MNFIKLFNVDFDDKYDDVIMFASKADQSSYFALRYIEEFEEDNISVVKEYQAVRVYGNYNKLQSVNYAYFENEIDGVTRGYYAFVTSVSWAGVGVVSLTLSVDVYQTYLFEHELAPSYVRRAHVHQYDPQNNPIRKYLYTPENIDYGDEYISSEAQYIDNNLFTAGADLFQQFKLALAWGIAVGTEPIKGSNNELITSSGGMVGEHDGLYYLAVPLIIGADEILNTDNIKINLYYQSNGATVKTPLPRLIEFIEELKASTQVISIYLLRSFPIPTTISLVPTTTAREYDLTIGTQQQLVQQVATPHNRAMLVPRWGLSDMSFVDLQTRGTFSKQYDIKAQCYPYRYFSITNDRGNELVIKPQYVNGHVEQDGDNFIYQLDMNITISVSVGIYAKQGVFLSDYLGNTPKLRQVVNTALGQLPQVTDRYLNFLQTQKASFDTGLNAIYENGVINAASNLASVGTNLLAGNYAGAATGAAGLATSIRSTAQKIELQQARLQDIRNTPDSLKKSGTDIKFEQISGFWGIYVTSYQIPADAMQRVSDYFTLYGYTINDFIKDFATFLDSRETYNYVQTNACRVTGNINVSHIRALEQIYDHGVRLWHYNATTWTGFDFNKANGDYYGTPRTPQTV